MPILTGGHTLYGHALGVLMLDTRFPRLPGDIGNATTWPFPVLYKVVKGALTHMLARSEPDPSLLEPFVAGARELEAQGVPAITTSCGFLAIYQAELAAAVSVPVFASPLLQVPLAARMIPPGKRVAIFTAREVLTERHFAGAGWSSKDTPVVVAAPPQDGAFATTFVGDRPEADPKALEDDVLKFTARAMRDHPDVGAIVLECANFPPFAQAIRRVARVPVFDLYTLGMHAYASTTGAVFDRSYL